MSALPLAVSLSLCICRQKTSSALFFKYNSQLGPPYQVLVDTNFINFAIKNKVSHALLAPSRACSSLACPVPAARVHLPQTVHPINQPVLLSG